MTDTTTELAPGARVDIHPASRWHAYGARSGIVLRQHLVVRPECDGGPYAAYWVCFDQRRADGTAAAGLIPAWNLLTHDVHQRSTLADGHGIAVHDVG